jgi:predicted nucleic acid-binding Zn ribbon protein
MQPGPEEQDRDPNNHSIFLSEILWKERAMPSYDYFCEANGVTVEVHHAMSERLMTWGAVCGAAGMPVGDTSPNTAVTRLISRAGVIHSGALRNPESPPCQTGAPCCGAERCGFQ